MTSQSQTAASTADATGGRDVHVASPATVFERHVAAFQAGDLTAVLEDFADDALLVTPDGRFEGKAAIATFYEQLLAEFGCITAGDAPGFELHRVAECADLLLVTWSAVSRRHQYPFGVDTFLVRDDRIVRQTVAFTTPVPRS